MGPERVATAGGGRGAAFPFHEPCGQYGVVLLRFPLPPQNQVDAFPVDEIEGLPDCRQRRIHARGGIHVCVSASWLPQYGHYFSAA